jgi:hypothetical protein
MGEVYDNRVEGGCVEKGELERDCWEEGQGGEERSERTKLESLAKRLEGPDVDHDGFYLK